MFHVEHSSLSDADIPISTYGVYGGEMLVGDGYLTDMFHAEQLLVEF